VFGEVLSGKSVIRQIESQPTQSGDKPVRDCEIFDCGQLSEEEAALVGDAPRQPDALGDKYEDYPEDEATGSTPLSAQKCLQVARDCKDYGNRAFKAGNIALAIDKYQKGLRYLNEDPELEGAPEGTKADMDAVRVALNSNAAQMSLKLSRWNDARDFATSALEVSSIAGADKAKALFRRASAAIQTKDEDSAIEDLEAAHKIMPDDAGITKLLGEVKAAAKARTAKEKAAYKKFFS